MTASPPSSPPGSPPERPRAPIDPEALTQVIAHAQLHSFHSARVDPLSFGNLARRAGVPDWNIQAALRLQALQASAQPPQPHKPPLRLGEALVQSGALPRAIRDHLLKRQRAMRMSKPSYQDALELAEYAVRRTLALAGLR